MDWQGDKFLSDLKAKTKKGQRNAGQYLVNKIKQKISKSPPPSSPGLPPDQASGTLEQSIFYRQTSDGVEVGSDAEYALFLEYGTSKMAARPFLRSTVNEEADNILKIITEAT